MVWTPQFSAVFEEPIINNALVVITRDMKPALDHFYAADDLPDFAERALGQVLGNTTPALAIFPLSNPTEDADDSSHIIEAAQIGIYIGVEDDGPDTVTRRIMKYVRALDAVLRTGKRDFFTNMSNPFGVWLEVDHVYGPIGDRQSTLFRSARLELTVNLRER